IVYELWPGHGEASSAGLRDREVAREKAPGVYRVLGLGDSHTYGEGVARERVFLKVAEQVLNQGGDGTRFEVLNFSVSGYNAAMEASVLEEQTAPWAPDLGVIQFCRNDFKLPNFLWTERDGIVAHSFAVHEALGLLVPLWPDFVRHTVMGYRWDGELFPVP